MSDSRPQKEIRVALNSEASAAYQAIKAKLKEVAPFAKFSPSSMVSFLVTDYLQQRFDSEMDILIAEFFDSDTFFQHARKAAKGQPNFDDLMADALTKARKIKKNRRRKVMAIDEANSGAVT